VLAWFFPPDFTTNSMALSLQNLTAVWVSIMLVHFKVAKGVTSCAANLLIESEFSGETSVDVVRYFSSLPIIPGKDFII
jgi:hypothetical protein